MLNRQTQTPPLYGKALISTTGCFLQHLKHVDKKKCMRCCCSNLRVFLTQHWKAYDIFQENPLSPHKETCCLLKYYFIPYVFISIFESQLFLYLTKLLVNDGVSSFQSIITVTLDVFLKNKMRNWLMRNYRGEVTKNGKKIFMCSFAQVHELAQSHCSDTREGTLFL